VSEHGRWSIYLSEHGRGDLAPAWLRRWKGDGLIARVENQRIANTLIASGLPTVDVSFALERSPFPRVVTDSSAAVQLAAAHLLERGFTQFGYAGDPRYHWSNVRSSFLTAHLKSLGHVCSVLQTPHNPNRPTTWERELSAIEKWLRKLPKPVGIVACYDIRGQQVLEACRRIEVKVPDEVAVIGIHNDELLCDLCDPPLSSVIPNARRAGYEAASALARMMKGETLSPQTILLEPVGIATRQSTDVVALTDQRISVAVQFIREHAHEKITVDEVVKAASMSRTVFERRFKKLLNRTPHEHILTVRIERVKKLLADTELTLAQIAERTGFDHVEYLGVAFKRLVGETPGRYRSRRRA
jgi:LacI family transcriptional regulator